MFLADLHIHSKYSRATSAQCTPAYLDFWARRKGIDLVGTGDFTHPVWRKELQEVLRPAESGFFVLKEEHSLPDLITGRGAPARFVLSAEISSIYKKNDRVRKVHNVILLPSFDAAETLSKKLEQIGNLHSDGRPILGLDSRDLLEITLSVCPEAVFIPAHIWTPHFSLFGAFSGFDTIEECFEDMTPYIHALETGLSSDPTMNRRLSVLDRFNMVSNSDAHSPGKLGREANVFHTELSYPAMAAALADPYSDSFSGTIEFFPEEGKYHLDGHRNCNLCLEPSKTAEYHGICPVCGKKITIGVLHRVLQLADRPEGFVPPKAKPFESLVPLSEIIAASMGLRSATGQKVQAKYETLLRELGNEFYLLREAPIEAIERFASFPVAEGVRRMRSGKVTLTPGFDGVYGKVKLFEEDELAALAGQMSFFGVSSSEKKPKEAETVTQFVRHEEALSKEPQVTKKEQLNPAQLEAVTTCARTVAVVAGPGTGKTKTLISRICYLVEELGVKPTQITAVTFTNKAAQEMRERLANRFGKGKSNRFQIGTFHSVCLKLLRDNGLQRALVDVPEAELLAKEVLKEQESTTSAKAFVQQISLLKNGAVGADDALPSDLLEAYNSKLEKNGVMDFDDVLLQGLELAGKAKSSCFNHLLVDEFQDSNDLQYRLIKTWSMGNESLFVIGDPDQSIYGFRGSNARCFALLAQDEPDLKTIIFSENYRSSPEILKCALPIINQNPGEPRMLHANAANGEIVQNLTAESDFSESVYVANTINRMVGGVDMLLAHSVQAQPQSNLDFSDIAVLYRTHRQAEALERCLTQEGIPYKVTGRDKLLSRPMVRGVVCFFRYLINKNDQLSRKCAFDYLYGERSDKDSAQEAFERLVLRFQGETAKPPKIALEQFFAETQKSECRGANELLHMAMLFDDMDAFLTNILLGQERDLERLGNDSYHASSVTLMTFHGAKGLEFPVVFLCGARRGLLPLETQKHTADTAEERRLFYVGMTRAKEQLILLHSGEQSPFLADLPVDSFLGGKATYQKNPDGGKQLSLFD